MPAHRRALLRASTVAACTLLLVGPAPLLAATVPELIGGLASAHPFAGRILPGGAESAYFAPALMFEVPDQAGLALFSLWQEPTIDLDPRPAGADVPDAIYGARLPGPGGTTLPLEPRPFATSALPRARGSARDGGHRLYLQLGTVRTVWKGRLAFGFLGVVPARQFQAQRPFFSDEREQAFSNSLHFERLGDRTEANTFVVALAARPVPRFAAGLGLRIANGSAVTNQIYVPNSGDQSTSVSVSEIVVRTRVTGHGSVLCTPWRGLRLSATLHLEEWSPTTTRTRTVFFVPPSSIDPAGTVSQSSRTLFWEPLRVGLGAGWEGRPAGRVRAWRAGFSALWQQWSRYRDRQGERPADPWHDAMAVAAGAEVSLADHRLAADLAFDPSPVPPQRGRSNSVDSHRVAGGLAWEFSWSVGTVRLGAGLAVQTQWLLPRRVEKSVSAEHPVVDEVPDTAVDGKTGQPLEGATGLQTNNPGWPGWRARALLLGAGASFKVFF